MLWTVHRFNFHVTWNQDRALNLTVYAASGEGHTPPVLVGECALVSVLADFLPLVAASVLANLKVTETRYVGA